MDESPVAIFLGKLEHMETMGTYGKMMMNYQICPAPYYFRPAHTHTHAYMFRCLFEQPRRTSKQNKMNRSTTN